MTFLRNAWQKKLTMYGAYWCSHCQAEKKLFGDSFKYVPYVECTQETKSAWTLVSAVILFGSMRTEKIRRRARTLGLSKISGCQLP